MAEPPHEPPQGVESGQDVPAAAPPNAAPPPEPPPQVGWLEWLRKACESRLSFCVMLAISVYVFFGVPQITNVWRQLPPFGAWWGLYVAYLFPLLAFYLGS